LTVNSQTNYDDSEKKQDLIYLLLKTKKRSKFIHDGAYLKVGLSLEKSPFFLLNRAIPSDIHYSRVIFLLSPISP